MGIRMCKDVPAYVIRKNANKDNNEISLHTIRMAKIWNATPNGEKCMKQQEFTFTACGDEIVKPLWKIGKERKTYIIAQGDMCLV